MDCYACRLTAGDETLLGGTIHRTDHWIVEHCMGPLGTGTLIVKPLRHTLSVGDLTPAESAELGPLLQRMSKLVQDLMQSDQVYVCLWSHAGWGPVHIHFVVQPAWNNQKCAYEFGGPSLQSAMFHEATPLVSEEVEAFCDRARAAL